MPQIYLDAKNGIMKITSYEGNSMPKEVSQLETCLEETYSQEWNFFRQGNNHAYVGGGMHYKGECKNNLVISPYKHNELSNVNNAFVFVGNSFIEISPITNLSNAIYKGKMKLSTQKINYHIPKSVYERENLLEKDFDRLKKEIKQKYRLKPKNISVINSNRTKNGIYYIISENGKEYVLKFRGREKKKAELLSTIAENISNYFPLNLRRKDNQDFTFEIENEFYGIEEFVRNISPKIRNIKYFSLLGTHIGLLHRQFSHFIESNKISKELPISMNDYLSESNLISLYLDLSKNEAEHKCFLSELEKITEEKLKNQINFSPKKLIHRDLNYSNLIWQGDNFKIVDSETLIISNRLNEFESPLLFGGNMTKPRYMKNSLKVIINSYNQSSQMPLSKKETALLPSLLKYALLRNFIIKKIRRGLDDKNYLKEIMKNLKIIEEDSG